MTNHYDAMRVSPDPSQAEELRQRLHARLASVSRDDHHGRSDVHLVSARVDPDERVVPVMEIFLSDDTSAPSDRTHRRRLVMAAAAIVVVVGAAGIAISRWNVGDEDRPLATGTSTTTGSLGREEIRVTPDFIQFGDGLVGLISNMARADGRTYVIAARYQTEGDLLRAPEEAVLAAFDDVGREVWRTELDGRPTRVVVSNGDLWVYREEAALTRIDSSDGRVLGDVPIGRVTDMVAAFESLWVLTNDPEANPFQLIRVDPDLSTTTVELQPNELPSHLDPIAVEVAAGAGAIWVPLRAGGVAMIDPDTLDLTVIPVDEIGHEVQTVAVDGDVAYVASSDQVTSIVGGQVVATVSPGEIWYLGPMDGTFGVLLSAGRFQILQANDPMIVEDRRISLVEQTGPVSEIDGEAWIETGRNYDLRRVEFLPVSAGGG